jgi:predicted DNA-binding protein
MTSILLDSDTERGLKTLAHLTGRSAPDLLHEAVISYLDDIQDAREAEAVYRRIEAGEEGVISLEESLRDDLAR